MNKENAFGSLPLDFAATAILFNQSQHNSTRLAIFTKVKELSKKVHRQLTTSLMTIQANTNLSARIEQSKEVCSLFFFFFFLGKIVDFYCWL